MANKQTISIKPDQAQLSGLYEALKRLDKEANTNLKNDVASISAWSSEEIRQAAPLNPFPAQAAKVAVTIRANKDRIPNVTIGGTKQPFSGGAVSGQILFGSEFGGPSFFPNGGRRFPYRSPSKGRGNTGYTIFKRLAEIQPEITHRWKNAVDKVLNDWSKG